MIPKLAPSSLFIVLQILATAVSALTVDDISPNDLRVERLRNSLRYLQKRQKAALQTNTPEMEYTLHVCMDHPTWDVCDQIIDNIKGLDMLPTLCKGNRGFKEYQMCRDWEHEEFSEAVWQLQKKDLKDQLTQHRGMYLAPNNKSTYNETTLDRTSYIECVTDNVTLTKAAAARNMSIEIFQLGLQNGEIPLKEVNCTGSLANSTNKNESEEQNVDPIIFQDVETGPEDEASTNDGKGLLLSKHVEPKRVRASLFIL